jgi:hypothetical protein
MQTISSEAFSLSPTFDSRHSSSAGSRKIVLLVRLREPALELCRLSSIDDREKALLEMVGTLMFNPTTNKDSTCGIYLIAGWAYEVCPRSLPHILNQLCLHVGQNQNGFLFVSFAPPNQVFMAQYYP